MENVKWHMGVKTLKEVQDRKPAVWFTQCWTMKLGQTCKTVEFYHPLRIKFMRSHWLGCKPKSLGLLACFQQGSTAVQQALVLPAWQSTALSLYLLSTVSGVFVAKLKSQWLILCIFWDTIIDRLVLGACINPYTYEKRKKKESGMIEGWTHWLS